MPALRRPLVLVLAGVLAAGACGAPVDEPSPSSPPPPAASPTVSAMPTYGPDSVIGGLAPDFPPEFAQLPPDTEVIASAARPNAETTRISLTLRSDLPVAEIAASYGALLTGLGFTAVPTSTPQGLAAITAYTRTSAGPTETVTVAVLDDGSARSASVSGDVVPAAPVP